MGKINEGEEQTGIDGLLGASGGSLEQNVIVTLPPGGGVGVKNASSEDPKTPKPPQDMKSLDVSIFFIILISQNTPGRYRLRKEC